MVRRIVLPKINMISSKRYYQNQQSTTAVTTTSDTSSTSLSWRYYNTMHGDDGYSPRCSSRMSSLWVQGHNPYTVDGTGGMTEPLSKCRSVQHRNGSARTQTVSRPLVLHFMTSRPDRMSALVIVVEENAALAYWPRLLERRTKVATLAQCVLSINLRLIR